MAKRKRDSEPVITHEGPDDQTLEIRRSRLQAKIEQSNIVLQRALKLARGFERQKLGRRQKTAKDKPQELLRLNEEIICLKQLDLTSTGQNYLIRRLSRAKRVRESPAFAGVYGEDAGSQIKGPSKGAEANVIGRLMNSNPVKEVMPDIVAGIFEILGLENNLNGPDASKNSDGRSKSNSLTGSGALIEQFDASNVEEFDRANANPRRSVHDRPQFVEMQSQSPSEGLRSRDESAHLQNHQHSIETDSETIFDVHEHSILQAPQISPTHEPGSEYSDSVSSLSSPERDLSASLDSSQLAPNAINMTRPSATTFLPSLTMGGYISGSDSDDDNQVRQAGPTMKGPRGPPDPLQRKNRRGQRARQQILERKYGGKANHLQNQHKPSSAQGSQDRMSGWDTRKGAVDKVSSRRKMPGKGRQSKGNPKSAFKATGANLEAVALRGSSIETKSLHPSWEAARKKKLQGAPPGARLMNVFKGKKVTFD